jgi:hypothetical protein
VPEPDENPIDAPENQEEPITENLQASSEPENSVDDAQPSIHDVFDPRTW